MSYSLKRLFPNLHLRNFRADFLGGLTAAIVALPLALAFGVSSGAGAITGLYGAIFVGIFAALFGGTPAQVSGPTGPMTVVMATIFTALITKYPDTGLAMSFTVVMLGGLFQILFGVLKLGTYITLMPYTVISGFMSGIGVIIIFLQLGPFFGHPGSASVIDSLRNFPTYVSQPNLAAVVLGLVTLAIVFTWPGHLNRIVPSPLLALVVGTLLSLLFFSNADLKQIGEIPTALPQPHFPTFQWEALKTMTGYGLMLATLGAIDSLLTSLVADNVTRSSHDPDRELIGQGIGNFLAGIFWGLPGAGATMRTVVNVQAGGKTPLSGMIHGVLLLVIMLGAGKLTEPIPQAVLAGILIKVGIDIIDWGFLKRAHHLSLKATGLMYGVLFLTVFVDLITAVAVGVFFANLLTVKGLSDLQSKQVKTIVHPGDEFLTPEEQTVLEQGQGRVILFHLSGPMSFGAAKAISQQMAAISDYDVLILDVRDVPRLGVTAALAIETMVQEAHQHHREVFLVGAEGKVRDRLKRLKLLDTLTPDNLFDDRLDALKQAIVLILKQV
ncbi:MAG: SulP family inorganic anion transporter [Gomphosphaeria aponina SAG 52.96 = DSM 107014]|uniref:SulP family inorganic anion transporter n=1 Tax=Gomphosphaeria aponina SAG 52.96 = DSM 107014 TaxID=1521640 RepID=A0A941JL02_9CHRO|nr:SulP family inorganic anion transporter [Gomphosphaeria aponina SAG 52.96 = DSM 107014]